MIDHPNHTLPEAPATRRGAAPTSGKRKAHALQVPTKKATPEAALATHTDNRFFNIHTARWLSVRGVFVLFLAWWLWTDGPQGYWGAEQWTESIAHLAGYNYQSPWYVTLVLYLILTAIANFLWIFVVAWWEWLMSTWSRFLFILLPISFLVLLPLTALDVVKSAAGFYSYFAPLDLAHVRWWLANGALAESFMGSVVAQLVVMILLGRWGKGTPEGGKE